ncbi:hypothetical protein ACFE04_016099 [Oxalis oulophora]
MQLSLVLKSFAAKQEALPLTLSAIGCLSSDNNVLFLIPTPTVYKYAMGCDYVKDYEFVAIFYADFQPAPDFLKKTIHYFKVANESTRKRVIRYSLGEYFLLATLSILQVFYTSHLFSKSVAYDRA